MRTALKQTARAVLALGLALAASGACLAQDKVSVRLKWFNQAQFAGFYVARDKGFYARSGLDVTINPGGPDFPAVQMVAGGGEDFGVTGADQILVARAKGVPVKALAVFYRKNPFVLFTLKKSGITQPAQFVGKRVGVKIGGNEEVIYRAVLKSAGVDAHQLVEVPVKFDITPLLDGKVDVWPGYIINEVLAAQEKGFAVNVIWPSDYGVNLYADTLFCSERTIAKRPEVVKRFVAATLEGWNYAVAHPEEAATITVRYGDHLTQSHELAMLKASVPLLEQGGKPIGDMDAQGWTSLEQVLLQSGFLKTPQDAAQAYTTRFLGP